MLPCSGAPDQYNLFFWLLVATWMPQWDLNIKMHEINIFWLIFLYSSIPHRCEWPIFPAPVLSFLITLHALYAVLALLSFPPAGKK